MPYSKESQDFTRKTIFPGAMVKSSRGEFGFYFLKNGKVIIKGIKEGGPVPIPSDKILAEFNDIEELISAEWVID